MKTSLKIFLCLIILIFAFENAVFIGVMDRGGSVQIGGANAPPLVAIKPRIHGQDVASGHILGADHFLALFRPFIQIILRFSGF